MSTSACSAVGHDQNSSGNDLTLVEQYNGTSWSIVSSPNKSTENGLNGVACPSSSDCWASGGWDANTFPNTGGTLVENGP